MARKEERLELVHGEGSPNSTRGKKRLAKVSAMEISRHHKKRPRSLSASQSEAIVFEMV